MSNKRDNKREPKRQKRVVLFTSPSCSWCSVAKKYLKDRGIRFTVVDVSKNRDAQKDCQKAGCRGVPVLLIGSRWICGFDKSKINKELQI